MKVVVENSLGVRSTFTDAQWAKVQKDSRYLGTFTVVNKIEVPKEIDKQNTQSLAADIETKAEKADKTKPQDKTK